MLFDEQLAKILAEVKTIAIIGAKDKVGSPVEHVGRYLIEQGYTIFPVHPVRKSAWGIECCQSIADLQEVPDVVCLFRASDACLVHAEEILATSWLPKVFWMQLGIVNEQAGKLMSEHGVTVVQDACLEVEHKRVMRV